PSVGDAIEPRRIPDGFEFTTQKAARKFGHAAARLNGSMIIPAHAASNKLLESLFQIPRPDVFYRGFGCPLQWSVHMTTIENGLIVAEFDVTIPRFARDRGRVAALEESPSITEARIGFALGRKIFESHHVI